MSRVDPYVLTLGDDAVVTVPAEVMTRHGWQPGTSLIAVDGPPGLWLMSPDDALDVLRSRLSGRDLVTELLAERSAEGERESHVGNAPTIAP